MRRAGGNHRRRPHRGPGSRPSSLRRRRAADDALDLGRANAIQLSQFLNRHPIHGQGLNPPALGRRDRPHASHLDRSWRRGLRGTAAGSWARLLIGDGTGMMRGVRGSGAESASAPAVGKGWSGAGCCFGAKRASAASRALLTGSRSGWRAPLCQSVGTVFLGVRIVDHARSATKGGPSANETSDLSASLASPCHIAASAKSGSQSVRFVTARRSTAGIAMKLSARSTILGRQARFADQFRRMEFAPQSAPASRPVAKTDITIISQISRQERSFLEAAASRVQEQ